MEKLHGRILFHGHGFSPPRLQRPLGVWAGGEEYGESCMSDRNEWIARSEKSRYGDHAGKFPSPDTPDTMITVWQHQTPSTDISRHENRHCSVGFLQDYKILCL